VAITVLAMAIGSAMIAMLGGFALSHSSEETTLAVMAAQSVADDLSAASFGDVFARYNEDPLDDPPMGESPGLGFAVPGLDPQAGDPDGLPGRIEFPGDGFVLLEDDVERDLGMPRDLNGDDVIDSLDHATDYRVLPVRIRVEWRGKNGDRAVELVTTLAGA